MARLVINIRNDDADMALAGFPFLGEQYIVSEQHGDACVVEIDLDERSDTTVAQEQYLNANPAVVGYSIEATNLHDEAL